MCRDRIRGKQPAPVECRLYAPDGGVVWKDAAGTKTVDKPSRWTVSAAGATDPVADTSPPEWIDHEPIVQLSEQRYGAPVIESTLVSNVPADMQLLELFQGSKRKEVKSLVARSSIHVGCSSRLSTRCGDSEQKANWKTHIDTLRAAMALSPESANKVWQTLVDQRGRPAAGDLYEMLCGYNADADRSHAGANEDRRGGAADRLAGGGQPRLPRAGGAGSWEITGKRLMPNPAANLAERTQRHSQAGGPGWRQGELKPVCAAAIEGTEGSKEKGRRGETSSDRRRLRLPFSPSHSSHLVARARGPTGSKSAGKEPGLSARRKGARMSGL